MARFLRTFLFVTFAPGLSSPEKGQGPNFKIVRFHHARQRTYEKKPIFVLKGSSSEKGSRHADQLVMDLALGTAMYH